MTKSNELPITILIAALNEELNIEKCVNSVSNFASRTVVVDSGSTDRTSEIAIKNSAEVVQFNYQGGYPKKRQWAIDKLDIQTEWVMLLDADEVVTDKLKSEIEEAIGSSDNNAYLITKGFHFMGRRMRYGGFSQSAVLLFRQGTARFEHLIDESSTAMDMEVHERLIVDGNVGRLNTPLIHDDYKGLEAYIDRHNKYSTWEAKVRQKYMSGDGSGSAVKASLFGDVQQRRRFLKLLAMKIPGEQWLWFFYHYIFRLGILEGRRGLIASRIRSQYIANVRAKIFELKQNR